MEEEALLSMEPVQRQLLDDLFDAFQTIAGGAPVCVLHCGAGVIRWSRGAAELFGLPGEYLLDSSSEWLSRIHPEDRRRFQDTMAALRGGKLRAYDLNYRVRLRDGGYGGFRAAGAVLRDGEGKPSMIGGVLINQGLTENTDAVTVLPNKYALYEELTRIMHGGHHAIALLVGVSKLSRINENHGYSYGNHVLQEIAWLIQEIVGERGAVYRTDAAIFAVLSERLSRQELAAIYDSVRLKLQRGIRVQNNRHSMTANGGMISVDGTHADPATIYSCLSYAYRESKHHRHGELVDFNGSVKYDVNESLERLGVIRDSIVEGCQGFSLDYQPVIDSATGRVLGAEALVRWENEAYGVVPPGEFLPILEKDFVFEELGVWILHRAMEDGARFLEKDPEFRLGINISASQVEDEYFEDSVTEALAATGFPAKNLNLEITKGCRLLEFERLQEIVEAMHRHGIRVGIDDFGAGFESVGFLRRFAADFIKFDRSLVSGIENDPTDREAMEYLARCAAIRGTEVIVKGVETPAMRDILKTCAVSGMQGNLYSRPVRFEKIMEMFYNKEKAEERVCQRIAK